ncbi:uncharacterized protein DS421_12g361100 [Arachis hypogaea]|nr:uncharacterized protein DS421_12g361100 [Arachis hypogaea]
MTSLNSNNFDSCWCLTSITGSATNQIQFLGCCIVDFPFTRILTNSNVTVQMRKAFSSSLSVCSPILPTHIFLLRIILRIRSLRSVKELSTKHHLHTLPTMPDRLKLVFHHGGKFETDPSENFIYTSDLYDEWVGVDEDYLDVFAITGYYRELGYDKVEACWFLDPEDGLKFGLRRLQVDQDLISMIKHCHENNIIHIYFEHGPSVPDIINVME